MALCMETCMAVCMGFCMDVRPPSPLVFPLYFYGNFPYPFHEISSFYPYNPPPKYTPPEVCQASQWLSKSLNVKNLHLHMSQRHSFNFPTVFTFSALSSTFLMFLLKPLNSNDNTFLQNSSSTKKMRLNFSSSSKHLEHLENQTPSSS